MRRAILVVDDEPLFRNAIADAIRARSSRYVVHAAGDGLAAIAALDQESFDCIVTDLTMPVMDGFGLLLEIYNRRLTTPVVVVSAHGDSAIRGRVLDLGAIRYLDKPVDLDELVGTVESLVAGQRSHIEGVTLAGLLQLLEMEQKTATVWVRDAVSGATGRLLLQEGKLVNAFAGDARGVEAAQQLVSWPHAVLDLASHARLDAPKTAPIPLTPLLLEAARLRDEAEASSARSLGGETIERIAAEETGEQLEKGIPQMNIEQAMTSAMEITGCVGVSLVDFESGMTLGSKGTGVLDLEIAAAGNTEVVRAKMRTMKALALNDSIEDILITLSTQYHILRPLRKMPNLFLYVALDRSKSNLAMGRLRAGQIESELTI